MKTIFYLTLLISTFSVFSINAQVSKDVLFIGNSYTAANNLPLMVSKLAQSTSDNITYSENSPGGQNLQGHSVTGSASMNLIQQGGWDFVVLQDQSQMPSFPMSQVATQVFPYAEILCNNIYQYSSCGEAMFFMTWGRKYGDANNCAVWPPVCTYNGMDSLLNLRYRMMADSNHALVSPVGAVWHYIRDTYPNIELYSADNSHPSLEGSYAAACTFYTLILQKDPTFITDDYGVNQIEASNIRSATKLIAYDSLAKWNVGKYNPMADFTTNVNKNIVQLTNLSENATSYQWDFGDGDTSSLFEPTHTYNSTGTFIISLVVSKCEKMDTISQTITIVPDGVLNPEDIRISLFPNPVKSEIKMQLSDSRFIENLKIISLQGNLIYSLPNRYTSDLHIDMSNIASGLYFLQMEINNRQYQYKLIKL